MHGYQLMQAISERSRGRWTPSPGAVYPAISQLEDEGLVTVTAEAGRKVVELTDEGREYLADHQSTSADPLGDDGHDHGPDLRKLMQQLHDAARQIGRSGTDGQIDAAAVILQDARRALYLVLADGPEAT